MTNDQALLPCPFCGYASIATFRYGKPGSDMLHCAICESCQAKIERVGTNSDDAWADVRSA